MRKLFLAILLLASPALAATPPACSGESVFPLLGSSQNDVPLVSAINQPCVVQLGATAAATITGVTAGQSGERLTLVAAAGNSAITLSNNSSSSALGNRFTLGTDVILAAGDSLTLQYSTLSRTWLPIGRAISNLAVPGTSTFTGALISPLVLGAASQSLMAWGTSTLTEAGGAETVFTLTTATTQTTGGTLEYTVRIVDSAGSPDYSIRTGHLQFNLSNSAGTTTCTGDASNQTDDDSFLTQQGTAKTNTYAITFVTAANACAVKFNIDSDIATVTSASITWVLRLYGPGAVS